jgi:hypothetical protein
MYIQVDRYNKEGQMVGIELWNGKTDQKESYPYLGEQNSEARIIFRQMMSLLVSKRG